MPALNVFEFAQRIQEYVTKDLGHPKWSIAKIVAVYSTRSKNTKFGYKVAPLFAGAIATDDIIVLRRWLGADPSPPSLTEFSSSSPVSR